jgi:hypothetical protein
MAATAAARPGSAQIICSATLFACPQSNEALPDSAASPAPAARTKASASAIPARIEESSIRHPSPGAPSTTNRETIREAGRVQSLPLK